MTKFYDWIMKNVDEDTELAGLANVMKSHPEKTWHLTTQHSTMRKKFEALDLGEVFDEAYKLYMKELSAPCKHDANNECFYVRKEIKSKPIADSGREVKGYRMDGIKHIVAK